MLPTSFRNTPFIMSNLWRDQGLQRNTSLPIPVSCDGGLSAQAKDDAHVPLEPFLSTAFWLDGSLRASPQATCNVISV